MSTLDSRRDVVKGDAIAAAASVCAFSSRQAEVAMAATDKGVHALDQAPEGADTTP
jgi:tRNA U38,U39,U40 pseudouridine synthase TruA